MNWQGAQDQPHPSHRGLGSALRSYLDGGTDEATSAVHLQHAVKELTPLGLIVGKVSLSQVDGLRNTTCEIY